MSQAWRAGAGSLGLAVASLAGASSARADAFDNAYVSGGTYVTYAFGATQPWGWGLEARAGGNTWDYQCLDDTSELAFAGGALRFEWFPSSHTRLIIAAQAGHTCQHRGRTRRAGRRLSLGARGRHRRAVRRGSRRLGCRARAALRARAHGAEPGARRVLPDADGARVDGLRHPGTAAAHGHRQLRRLARVALYAPRRSRSARGQDFHARASSTDQRPPRSRASGVAVPNTSGLRFRRSRHSPSSCMPRLRRVR